MAMTNVQKNIAVEMQDLAEQIIPVKYHIITATAMYVAEAMSSLTDPEIQEAVAEGKAIAWGNKQRLGAIFGRDETAVCAVLHDGVAKAIKSARQQALPFAGGVVRSEAWWSSEDR